MSNAARKFVSPSSGFMVLSHEPPPMLNASSALSLRLPIHAAMQRFGRSPVAQLAEKATLSPAGGDVYEIVSLRPSLFGQMRRAVLGTVARDAVAAIAPDLDPAGLMLRITDLGNTHLPWGEGIIFASVWPKKASAQLPAAVRRPRGPVQRYGVGPDTARSGDGLPF